MESFSEPRIASATARQHGISNQLMFAWRKAYREGRLGGSPVSWFVPAVIMPDAPKAGPGEGRLEIVTSNGRRVFVDRDIDADALVRVVRALETELMRLSNRTLLVKRIDGAVRSRVQGCSQSADHNDYDLRCELCPIRIILPAV